jgi:hypothetical protein
MSTETLAYMFVSLSLGSRDYDRAFRTPVISAPQMIEADNDDSLLPNNGSLVKSRMLIRPRTHCLSCLAAIPVHLRRGLVAIHRERVALKDIAVVMKEVEDDVIKALDSE